MSQRKPPQEQINYVLSLFKSDQIQQALDLIDTLSKDDLIKELQKKVVSCKDVQFTFLGLSLALINTIISFILSVITLKHFLNYEKSR